MTTPAAPAIGAVVHYVLPGGRCRPGLVVERGAYLAAERAAAEAGAAYADAQVARLGAQETVEQIATEARGARLSAESLTSAQAAVATLTRAQEAASALEAAAAEVGRAKTTLEAARKAQRSAVDVVDLQIFGDGQADGDVFALSPTAPGMPYAVPLTVLRLAVKHDRAHGAGTWHLVSEDTHD